MHIAISNICSAFQPTGVIGSKVTDQYSFLREVKRAIEAHDFTQGLVPGQAAIEVNKAAPYVSSGVGPRLQDVSAYVLREHRGQVSAYLKREYASAAAQCTVIVYTKEAYFADPDVTVDEMARVAAHTLDGNPVTHVLVAVLAFVGPVGPLSPYRFVMNLAGGNREAQLWSAEVIRAKACEIAHYHSNWITVADDPE